MLKEWSHSGDESCASFHKVRVRACLPVQSSLWSQVSANSPIDRYCFSLVASALAGLRQKLLQGSLAFSCIIWPRAMCTHSHKHTHAHACTKRSKQMLICVQRQTEKNKDMAHARSTSHIAFCRAYEDNPHGHKQCTAVYLLQTWTHTHTHTHTHTYDSCSLPIPLRCLISTVPHVLSSQAGSTGSLSCYPCIICGCRYLQFCTD